MGDNNYELTQAEALELYFDMVLARKTEDKHEEMFQKQVVPVYTHLGTGQEAVGCGVTTLLRQDDYLIGTHRGVTEYVGKGLSVKDIFLEYGGRVDAISGGRAGLHLHSPRLNILPLLGGLGTDFSLAVGAGLSVRNNGLDRVVVDYFGEGATEQADFHPAMNMAMLYQVPVIFCCCTNQFVEYHPYRESTCTADIAPRAKSYGMPSQIVADGNDMFAVGRAMKKAIAYARDGKGPYFIEFKTYRIAPHHTADQCLYRDEKEFQEAQKNDPIPRAEEALMERGWATIETFAALSKKSVNIIEEAVETLAQSKLPDPASVLNHAVMG